MNTGVRNQVLMMLKVNGEPDYAVPAFGVGLSIGLFVGILLAATISIIFIC